MSSVYLKKFKNLINFDFFKTEKGCFKNIKEEIYSIKCDFFCRCSLFFRKTKVIVYAYAFKRRKYGENDFNY